MGPRNLDAVDSRAAADVHQGGATLAEHRLRRGTRAGAIECECMKLAMRRAASALISPRSHSGAPELELSGRLPVFIASSNWAWSGPRSRKPSQEAAPVALGLGVQPGPRRRQRTPQASVASRSGRTRRARRAGSTAGGPRHRAPPRAPRWCRRVAERAEHAELVGPRSSRASGTALSTSPRSRGRRWSAARGAKCVSPLICRVCADD